MRASPSTLPQVCCLDGVFVLRLRPHRLFRPERCNADYIARLVTLTTRVYNLDNVADSITTDGASDMRACNQILIDDGVVEESVPCACHKISRLLKTGLSKEVRTEGRCVLAAGGRLILVCVSSRVPCHLPLHAQGSATAALVNKCKACINSMRNSTTASQLFANCQKTSQGKADSHKMSLWDVDGELPPVDPWALACPENNTILRLIQDIVRFTLCVLVRGHSPCMQSIDLFVVTCARKFGGIQLTTPAPAWSGVSRPSKSPLPACLPGTLCLMRPTRCPTQIGPT